MNSKAEGIRGPVGWRRAWVLLCLAFALHIVDEAAGDFLSYYNAMVRGLRHRWDWFPAPTLSFGPWISLLVAAVFILLMLAPLAHRGATGMKILSYIFAVVMALNGLLHLLAAFFERWAVPGVYTAPLLVAASVYLFYSLGRARGSS